MISAERRSTMHRNNKTKSKTGHTDAWWDFPFCETRTRKIRLHDRCGWDVFPTASSVTIKGWICNHWQISVMEKEENTRDVRGRRRRRRTGVRRWTLGFGVLGFRFTALNTRHLSSQQLHSDDLPIIPLWMNREEEFHWIDSGGRRGDWENPNNGTGIIDSDPEELLFKTRTNTKYTQCTNSSHTFVCVCVWLLFRENLV